MDSKEIALQIVNGVEVKGKEQFEAVKGQVNAFIDFMVGAAKQSVMAIETEEQLEQVVKEILELKISNQMIDDIIRLPIALEWTDDVIIKATRPVVVNFLVGTIKKQLVVRFGGADWFAKFKAAVFVLPDPA
ncbi:MAG: hypothetical protein A2293_09325 [Elusimicrobia bacterium RIFOXYB2_FULL_49_7]|nr:MAG: hypothetical protein A2293_09325 [Elusimicrobia bacterium RIFOXYB2_FULL_49_7]